MTDSRTILQEVLRKTYGNDVSPIDSADEIVVALRAAGWRLVSIEAIAHAVEFMSVEKINAIRYARQLLAVVDDVQGEMDAADHEVVIEDEGETTP